MLQKNFFRLAFTTFMYLICNKLNASCEVDFAFDPEEKIFCQEVSRAITFGFSGRPYGVESKFDLTLALNAGLYYATLGLPCSDLKELTFPENSSWQKFKAIESCNAFTRFYMGNGLLKKAKQNEFSNMIYRASVQARKYFKYGEKYCESEISEHLSTCIGIVEGIKLSNQPYLTDHKPPKLPPLSLGKHSIYQDKTKRNKRDQTHRLYLPII